MCIFLQINIFDMLVEIRLKVKVPKQPLDMAVSRILEIEIDDITPEHSTIFAAIYKAIANIQFEDPTSMGRGLRPCDFESWDYTEEPF